MAIGSIGAGSMGGDHGRGQFQGFSYMPTSQLESMRIGSVQGSPPMAPSSIGALGLAGSASSSSQPIPAMPSVIATGNGSLGLMNCQFMPGGNPGAYAAPQAVDLGSDVQSGMQVGIANMMSSQGAGGFSEMSSLMMKNDPSAQMETSDEDLFAVSL